MPCCCCYYDITPHTKWHKPKYHLLKMMISVHHLFHENFVLCTRFSQKGVTLFHEKNCFVHELFTKENDQQWPCSMKKIVLCTSFSQERMNDLRPDDYKLWGNDLAGGHELFEGWWRRWNGFIRRGMGVPLRSSRALHPTQTEGGAPHPSCNALLPEHYPA